MILGGDPRTPTATTRQPHPNGREPAAARAADSLFAALPPG
jgi:hypothetical protein